MSSALNELANLLPPPTSPVETHGNWEDAERRLGIRLPEDYKRYIERYGTGCISGEFYVLSPFTQNQFYNIHYKVKEIDDWSLQGIMPPISGNDFFPKPGGLLVCAVTNDGDSVFWPTAGPPSTWGVVLDVRQMLSSYQYPTMSLTEFILKLVKMELDDFKIPICIPPYRDVNVLYEFLTFAESERKFQE